MKKKLIDLKEGFINQKSEIEKDLKTCDDLIDIYSSAKDLNSVKQTKLLKNAAINNVSIIDNILKFIEELINKPEKF